jgi:hypothetical protein
MQVSGRVIILAAFGLAIAMSGGAWWYHYTQVRQAAAFWGSPGGRLLVRGPEVTFYALGVVRNEANGKEVETIAGRAVVSASDLSAKQGLVHLRHALYQDLSFQWEGRRREPIDAADDWVYAVQFAEGDEAMTAIFPRDFSRVGHLIDEEIDVLPSPRISESVQRYLTDIGAINGEEGGAKPQAAGR